MGCCAGWPSTRTRKHRECGCCIRGEGPANAVLAGTAIVSTPGRCVTPASIPSKRVDAPGATADDDEIEENKAIQDRRIATVQHREERAREMRHEIGDGHFAGEQER